MLLAFGYELLLLAAGLRFSTVPALALAMGMFLFFLAGMLLHVVNAPAWIWALTALALAAPGVTRLPKTDLRPHAIFLLFLLLGESYIRNFGGGFWYADWYEHYERTLYFIVPMRPDTKFLGGYLLTARPPLFNVLMAFPLKIFGAEFWRYQAVGVMLNSLVFFPLAMATRKHLPLAWLLIANLYVFQNCTYPWTKLLATFYVILGLWLYLQQRTTAAAASLAAGVLTHYMAAPYFLVTALHAVITRPKTILKPIVVSLLVLSPWLLYATLKLGTHATLHSNTTSAVFHHQTTRQNLRMMAGNLYTTLVPHRRHPGHLKDQMDEPALPRLRDELFLWTVHCFPLSLGLGTLVILLVRRPRLSRTAWQIGIPTFILSVIVNPGVDPYGTAHIGLAPLILALIALAAEHSTPKLLVLPLIDLAAVVLHTYLQAIPPRGQGGATPQNWELKQQLGLFYLADLTQWWSRALMVTGLAALTWQESQAASRESLIHEESHPEV